MQKLCALFTASLLRLFKRRLSLQRIKSKVSQKRFCNFIKPLAKTFLTRYNENRQQPTANLKKGAATIQQDKEELMAIRVICPDVSLHLKSTIVFAVRRARVQSALHTIEIPKEKLIVHEPDTIMDGGKPRRAQAGHDAPDHAAPLHLHGQAGLWGIMITLGAMAPRTLSARRVFLWSAKSTGYRVFLIAFPLGIWLYPHSRR